MKCFNFILFILFLSSNCLAQKDSSIINESNIAQRINLVGFSNLYKVDSGLYRSEQPKRNSMKMLEKMGVKTVLNVRNIRNDNFEAKSTKLVLKHVSINTWTMSYAEMICGMKVIMNSEKPVLIHCKHGSDRTGCVVAAYRMALCGWTKENAIREFKDGGFGYHEDMFPNLLKLLNSIDIEQLKKDVGIF